MRQRGVRAGAGRRAARGSRSVCRARQRAGVTAALPRGTAAACCTRPDRSGTSAVKGCASENCVCTVFCSFSQPPAAWNWYRCRAARPRWQARRGREGRRAWRCQHGRGAPERSGTSAVYGWRSPNSFFTAARSSSHPMAACRLHICAAGVQRPGAGGRRPWPTATRRARPASRPQVHLLAVEAPQYLALQVDGEALVQPG